MPNSLFRDIFFLVTKRALTRDQFEVFVETGKIIEPAFVTKLFNTQVIFDQKFACVAHPDLDQELRIGFSCS